jgi:hypothetical protein
MPILLIIDKSGAIKELNVKTYVQEDLYKKAGFKTADGFELATTWDIEFPTDNNKKKYFISVYGKKKGRAGQENKYDFPPPIDSDLFFGSCILVNQLEGDSVSSLTTNEWNKIYEFLFGGFEDIGCEDSEEDSEDEDDHIPKTKSGYAKDGFVVEDSGESEESDSDFSDEIEVIPKKKAKILISKVKVTKKPATTNKKKKTVFDNIELSEEKSNQENLVLQCSDELQEEEYL